MDTLGAEEASPPSAISRFFTSISQVKVIKFDTF